MTDLEILKLAAKAAMQSGLPLHYGPHALQPKPHWQNGADEWRPLADDGDALRLAAKLQMELRITGNRCLARVPNVTDWVDKYSHGDPMDATRLAITLVAAEVGKTME